MERYIDQSAYREAVIDAAVHEEERHHPTLRDLDLSEQREFVRAELTVPTDPDDTVMLEGQTYTFDEKTERLELKRDPTVVAIEEDIVEVAELYGWGDFVGHVTNPTSTDLIDATRDSLEKLLEKGSAHQATHSAENRHK